MSEIKPPTPHSSQPLNHKPSTMAPSPPWKSCAACRWLEILSKTPRDFGDDLEEYCRQFKICSDLISPSHVPKSVLANMFLHGYPQDGSQPDIRRYYKARDVFGVEFLSSINLNETIKAAKTQAAAVAGIPYGRLVSTTDTTVVDRLLRHMDIKTHSKADIEANRKFDNFISTLTSSSDAQLATRFFGKVPEWMGRSSSTVSSQSEELEKPPTAPRKASDSTASSSGNALEPVQFTPSTASPDDSEADSNPDLHVDITSLSEEEGLSIWYKNLIANNTIDTTTGEPKEPKKPSSMTREETRRLYQAVIDCLQYRLACEVGQSDGTESEISAVTVKKIPVALEQTSVSPKCELRVANGTASNSSSDEQDTQCSEPTLREHANNLKMVTVSPLRAMRSSMASHADLGAFNQPRAAQNLDMVTVSDWSRAPHPSRTHVAQTGYQRVNGVVYQGGEANVRRNKGKSVSWDESNGLNWYQ